MENDVIKEETLAEMESRLGTVGDLTPEFAFLSGRGRTEQNYILENEYGLTIDPAGDLRDCVTGELITEEKLYVE